MNVFKIISSIFLIITGILGGLFSACGATFTYSGLLHLRESGIANTVAAFLSMIAGGILCVICFKAFLSTKRKQD